MSIIDFILAGLIFLGAVYLLYRSIWNKKGHCPGCDSEMCKVKKTKK